MALESKVAYDRSRSIFIGVTVTFILATAFVCARIVSRFFILKQRKWDDYSIILAWIFALAMCVVIDFSTTKGLGREKNDIPPASSLPLLASEYTAFILYNPALMATKTSILIFYIRISKNIYIFLHWASYVTLAIVNVSGIVLTFLTIFRCNPVQGAFIPDVKARCISIEALYLGSAPTSIATDLAILVLPIPVLTSMKLPRQQKFILVLTFLAGASVTAVDAVRIYYLQLAAISVNHRQLSSVDPETSLAFSYNAGLSLLLSAMEVNIGIICACVPVMRPLIRRVFPSKVLSHFVQRHSESVSVREEAPPPLDQSVLGFGDLYNPEEHLAGVMDGSYEVMQANALNGNRRRTGSLAVELSGSFNSRQTPEEYVDSALLNIAPVQESILNMRDSKSFKYCAMIIAVYSIWSFTHAMFFINTQIPIQAQPTPAQSQGIICATYSGRIFGPFVALWALGVTGYKRTVIISLGIYCVGALMFWPSASLRSFPGFLVSSFVIGLAISVLMTAAYGFLVLVGSPHRAECRLCLATSIVSTTTVLGGILGQKLLVPAVVHSRSLLSVQWMYLSCSLSATILGLGFYYMPLPEIADSDLQTEFEQLQQRIGSSYQRFFGCRLRVIYITLFVAVLAMAFSNGAWASSNEFSRNVVIGVAKITSSHPYISAANFYIVTSAVYAGSQAIFAPISLVVPSHALLLLALIGAALFAGLTMLKLPTVNGTLTIRLIFYFFEAPVFPLIFAIGARGMGRRSRLAICLIISASGLGPSVFPWAMQSAIKAHGIQLAFVVVTALCAASTIFPLYLMLFRPARNYYNSLSIVGGGRMRDNVSMINSTTSEQPPSSHYH